MQGSTKPKKSEILSLRKFLLLKKKRLKYKMFTLTYQIINSPTYEKLFPVAFTGPFYFSC